MGWGVVLMGCMAQFGRFNSFPFVRPAVPEGLLCAMQSDNGNRGRPLVRHAAGVCRAGAPLFEAMQQELIHVCPVEKVTCPEAANPGIWSP